MKFLEISLIVIYGAALLFIFFYSLIQLHLVYLYVRSKWGARLKNTPELGSEFPYVTVQLPVYNEMYVVERLIDSVANFDYPKDKLEIQILDDSIDETSEIIRRKVEQYGAEGFNIVQIQREKREGFKAGALQKGMEEAKGEFIAIFDADFLPTRDFLQKTIPHFRDEKIGVVQTKWGHINRNYSLLTRLQAFGLDAHFSIEQTGRNEGKHFINFNGTAGVWRKQCIIDAGGWQSDTLTEDLDLSYRAQIKGWKFKYLEKVVSPAELPAVMSALKTQQFRWTKGAAETAKKNLMAVLRSRLPVMTKVHAIFHLLNSTIFICVLLTAVLSIPILLLKHSTTEYRTLITIATFFLISLFYLCIFYWAALYQEKKSVVRTTFSFFNTFPLFLSVSMGLSLHNAIAVIEGYLGRKTAFIRTPKFNIVNPRDNWRNNKYLSSKISLLTVVEGLFALYFLAGIFLGVRLHDFALMPFHIMLFLGFSIVFYYSMWQARLSN